MIIHDNKGTKPLSQVLVRWTVFPCARKMFFFNGLDKWKVVNLPHVDQRVIVWHLFPCHLVTCMQLFPCWWLGHLHALRDMPYTILIFCILSLVSSWYYSSIIYRSELQTFNNINNIEDRWMPRGERERLSYSVAQEGRQSMPKSSVCRVSKHGLSYDHPVLFLCIQCIWHFLCIQCIWAPPRAMDYERNKP